MGLSERNINIKVLSGQDRHPSVIALAWNNQELAEFFENALMRTDWYQTSIVILGYDILDHLLIFFTSEFM